MILLDYTTYISFATVHTSLQILSAFPAKLHRNVTVSVLCTKVRLVHYNLVGK